MMPLMCSRAHWPSILGNDARLATIQEIHLAKNLAVSWQPLITKHSGAEPNEYPALPVPHCKCLHPGDSGHAIFRAKIGASLALAVWCRTREKCWYATNPHLNQHLIDTKQPLHKKKCRIDTKEHFTVKKDPKSWEKKKNSRAFALEPTILSLGYKDPTAEFF